MRKIIILAFFAFLLPVASAAVSSQEAVNLVSSTLLFENESTEILPSVLIGYLNQKYWVVSVVSGESLNSLVPVSSKDPADVAKTPSERRELVRTAFIIRNYSQLKESLAKQGKWVFSSTDSRFLQQLAADLGDERFDLETARTELSQYPDIQGSIDLLQEGLSRLKQQAELLSKETDGLIEFESAFMRTPDTNSVNSFKAEFDAITGAHEETERLMNAYVSGLDKVKQEVAQTKLDIDTKRSLSNLLSSPQRLQGFSSMISNAALFEEKLQEIFDNALARRDTLTANLGTRIEKNKAFQALYGTSQGLIEKTNGDYSTLEEAVNSIFAGEFEPLWKEQNELAKLKEGWKKAQAYYNAGNYGLAVQLSASAKNSAIKIYRAGFKEPEKQTGINTGLLINGIIVLVVLLILLFALRNRKKLYSLVSEPLGGQEYE